MSHPIPPPPLDLPPARSTTDPPSKHGHHHIHRPHRSHHHGHRDKSVPQSAILPSSTSNLFKSESSLGDLLSPLTKVGSRFESHHSRGQSGSQNDYSNAGAGFGPGHERRLAHEEADDMLRRERETREERERRLWKEVERKRSERGEADEYLQSSLTGLSTLSTSTTRRLDYTHYSLLSHLSSLVSTLSALTSLASSSSTHLDSFNKSTSDLSHDTKTQLQQFENIKFEEQKRRAVGLERRLKGARAKVTLLEDRLTRAGEQVQQVEGAEKEKGKRMRWRWKCAWIACGGIFALLILLLMTRPTPADMEALPGDRALMQAIQFEENLAKPQELQEMNATTEIDERTSGVSAKASKGRGRTADEWDSTLRMLEEL
ncbi:MAG: hypothetical protein Q9215_005202 [Flavoplaca cf. flavocitrina]